MRCRNCGRECIQTSAQSVKIEDGVYQTSRTFKCRKCGNTYTVTDDPVQIKKGD